MKVLIVNTSERTGGAAVAASRLTEALINNGVKAKMLVGQKQTAALYVAPIDQRLRYRLAFVWERAVIWLRNRLSKKNLFKVSIANAGVDITKTQEFKEADIIHLHWVNQGLLSLKGLEKILNSGKPVVWTMHDMWEATAICHHAYDCHHYEEACGECPFLLHPSQRDLSNQIFRKKQRMLAKADSLTFVAVSQWLAGCSRKSALIGAFPIEVIPNVISLSRFTIVDRNDARSTLGVTEPWVISFGAARLDDPIKGFEYLAEALEKLTATGRLRRDDVRLLLFGNVRDAGIFDRLTVPYTHLGYIDEEDRMSLIYSASNTTVSSSLYETFGQTLIEAMACGSVPVSFDGSGQADIITHQKNGYLAKRLSAESLAEGIMWALHSQLTPQELRRSVSRRYCESVVANRYVELYNRLLHTKK